ncbi:hypothetical protein Vretimale_4833 [Volvox reticuliferus]|uniref:Metaxin n=1 Tax=Volvox reticuliferus TaxID=1737510 RepID=A0A8J4G4H6_9CHLO|nr:hypothetical protein Vretifemale_3453 [Volvox reticuliferus]GIL99688.1 hypothetical protein Vretimale_4833 [Volvox reticuliferus]
MSSQPICIIYKWSDCWGLPSLSPACIQAEAYLRLTGVDFAVEVCSTSSSSPTGQLPALERGAYISPGASDEFASAAAVIAYAKKHIKDLDAHLSLSQRADLLAFANLIESRLNVATNVTMWCEGRGFSELKKAAYSGKLPFPLNQLVPWSKQREVRRRLAQTDMDQVYPNALEVLDAIADRLRSTGGPFLFGAKPTTVDALLMGHLLFYRLSPAVAPVLQDKVQSQRVLCEYVDRLLGQNFSVPALPRSALEASTNEAPSWTDAAKGQKKPTPTVVEPSPAEQQFRRHSYYWLLGAGAAIASYILLSGRYIQFATVMEQAGEDEADNDDDEEDVEQ